MKPRRRNDKVDPILTEIQVTMARRRMTQVQLAEAVGQHSTWVNRRLRGVIPITVEDLMAMAEALSVPAASFFRRDEGDEAQFVNFRSA